MKKLITILTILFFTNVNSQIINTIVGIGTSGNTNDNSQASTAKISPNAIALDVSGNLYIASGNKIRKVNATSGIITTVAGGGNVTTDGGLATSSKFTSIKGVAVDALGNFYIAAEHKIRKVNSNGIISTIAGTGIAGLSGDGGQASLAQLYSPEGIAIDLAGNLYIADNYNMRVRKIATDGVISTIAGSGIYPNNIGSGGDGGLATSAKLYNPQDVAVDQYGNVYIADASNKRIRKVNTNGIISTIAGKGTSSYSGDGGEAINAEIASPWGIDVDDLGNVYVADFINNRIRMINSHGIISTIAGSGGTGTGSGAFNGDGGQATSAQLNYPYDVVVDNKGNIYIADFLNYRVRKFCNSGTIVSSSSPLCSNNSATLTCTSSGSKFTWNTGQTNISSIVVKPNSQTTYTVTSNVACNNNVISNSITISLISSPNVSITSSNSNTNFCSGSVGHSTLTANGAINYAWNNYSQNASIDVYPTLTTNYYVVGTSSNGCTDTANITLFFNSLPQPSVIISGNKISTQNFSTYQWYLNNMLIANATNQNYIPLVSGLYSVHITDINGCSNTSTGNYFDVKVSSIDEIANDEKIIFYPNPVNSILYFNSEFPMDIEITNSLGIKVLKKNLNEIKQINFSEYETGLYYLKVLYNNSTTTYKILKN